MSPTLCGKSSRRLAGDCVGVFPDGWETWSAERRKAYTGKVAAQRLAKQGREWDRIARPKQVPPNDPRHHLPDANGFRCGCNEIDNDYQIWLFLAGRGCGKTLAGANWILKEALANPNTTWAVCAPTHRDVRQICIEGTDSGILAQAQGPIGAGGEIISYNINDLTLTLNNGSKIVGVSAEKDASIRGYNLSGCWFDEICSVRHDDFYYQGLIPALRRGESRMLITTTPKSTPILRDLVKRWKEREGTGDTSVHLTRATTWENSDNLSATALNTFHRMYDGTTIGRQEIEGELLEDLQGALFQRRILEENYVDLDDFRDEMQRIIVAIDPATTSDERSDESGIVVVGSYDGHAYVLGDYSMKGTPEEVMGAAVRAYYVHCADTIVFESNMGGDYLPAVLRTVNPNVPWKMIRASRGKLVRAEPVSALAEQGRLHLTDAFDRGPLMDQLCALMPGVKNGHDDRADAMVYAIAELIDLSGGSYLDAYGFVECGNCNLTYKLTEKMCKCGVANPHFGEQNSSVKDTKRKGLGQYELPYVRRCPTGHVYSRFAAECPHCGVTGRAIKYLRRATTLSGVDSKYLSHDKVPGLRQFYNGR